MKRISTVYVEEVVVRNSGKRREPGPHHTVFERDTDSTLVRMRTSHGHTVHLPVARLKEIVAAL
jgi:hypothetical protein